MSQSCSDHCDEQLRWTVIRAPLNVNASGGDLTVASNLPLFLVSSGIHLPCVRILHVQSPCERCSRLNKICVPHISQQGRGKKRRRTGHEGSQGHHGAASNKSAAQPGQSQRTEDVLVKSFGGFRPEHFGLRYLVWSWVSFALRRRSFALLTRPGMLATKIGITMDDIFCGKESDGEPSHPQRPLSYLAPVLATPFAGQHIGDTRLQWCEILGSSEEDRSYLWGR